MSENPLNLAIDDLTAEQLSKARTGLLEKLNAAKTLASDASADADARRAAIAEGTAAQADIVAIDSRLSSLAELDEEAAKLANEPAPTDEQAPAAVQVPADQVEVLDSDKAGELVAAAQQDHVGQTDVAAVPAPVVAAFYAGTDEHQKRINNLTDLGSELQASLNRSSERDAVITASLWDVDPSDILSGSNGAYRNGQIMGAFPELDENGVAAGFCAPPEIIRDIPFCVREDTPVADKMTSRPMARGAVQIPREIGLVDASFDWSYGQAVACPPDPDAEAPKESDQDLADYHDPSTWKGECATAECPAFNVFTLEAMGWCFEVCRDQDLSNPEGVARYIQAVRAGFARHSESKLLEDLKQIALDNGNSYSYGSVMSAGPDLATGLEAAMAQIESFGRISLGNYCAVIPEMMSRYVGLENYKRADCCSISAANIFSEFGVTDVTTTPDWATSSLNPAGAAPIGAAGATVPLAGPDVIGPRVFDVLLVDTTKTQLGTGQTLSIGTGTDFRDWGMVRTNCRALFFETERTVISSSCTPVVHLQVELCPTGARAGYLEPVCA